MSDQFLDETLLAKLKEDRMQKRGIGTILLDSLAEVEHERDWQCFLKCGKQGIALFEVDDGEEVHGGSEVNHMALRLDSGEYERVKATLEDAGIEVRGRKGDPHCIYFHDPDGHQLQFLMPNE